jgi:hypothetical protein
VPGLVVINAGQHPRRFAFGQVALQHTHTINARQAHHFRIGNPQTDVS